MIAVATPAGSYRYQKRPVTKTEVNRLRTALRATIAKVREIRMQKPGGKQNKQYLELEELLEKLHETHFGPSAGK
jgi:hypothetical protein